MRRSQIAWVLCLLGLGSVLICAWAGQDSSVYDDHGKRDPVWPLVSPVGNIINYDKEFQASDLKIEGIMLGVNGQNLTIINGQIVKEGDLLGSLMVEAIGKNTVTLKQGEQKFELKLNKEE
jgi:hypothetical protein